MCFEFYLLAVIFLQPFWLALAYLLGRGKKREKAVIPSILPKQKELSCSDKREIKEWENILNYDGTKESQEEIL